MGVPYTMFLFNVLEICYNKIVKHKIIAYHKINIIIENLKNTEESKKKEKTKPKLLLTPQQWS